MGEFIIENFYLYFQGILIFQICLFSFLYQITKRKDILFYMLFLGANCIYFFINAPMTFFNISDDVVFSSVLYEITNYIILLVVHYFYLKFLIEIFKDMTDLPQLVVIRKYATLLLVFLGCVFILFSYIHLPRQSIFYLGHIFSVPIGLYFIMSVYRQKLPYVKYVIKGILFSIFGTLLTVVMIVRYNTGQRDYFFDEFPLLYMKIGILAEIFLFQFAILNKWYNQEKTLITKDYENKLEISKIKNQISRELHDDVGTTLSKINLQTYLAIQKQKDTTYNLSQVLHSIQNSSEEILSRLKDIVWFGDENRTNFDLLIALSEYAHSMCESKGVKLIERVDQNKSNEISVDHKYQLLLICKEAVNNALKYSNCDQLIIEIKNDLEEHLNISISDDGNGFETNMTKTGSGLKNMLFRAEKIHARLQIHSVLKKGTTVQLTY
ncbi:MAG: hypothetical protein IPG18_01860 [Saprospiraceae bacterium]|nr:hypothetical protein [Saprospiraceae bacterium]